MMNEGSPKNKKDNGISKNKSILINKKIEQQQKGSHGDDKPFSDMTQSTSLVKYDTPFLVSTTISNKKTLDELEDNNENAEKFLRNLINKRGGEGEKSEYEDYSVKDALNKILPPKQRKEFDQLWIKYVSCTPVTKAEVVNLQEGLDRRLQTMQARETGICPIREQLYGECFDELIRQVTINCLERGIWLMRMKKEIQSIFDQKKTGKNLEAMIRLNEPVIQILNDVD